MPPVAAKLVASGLDSPVFATAPPGDLDRLFVVEQHSGLVKILRLGSGRVDAEPFLEIPELSTGQEQGLLGLAFHPQYAGNGLCYVNFTDPDGHTKIRRYRVSANPDKADPASALTVLTVDQPFANHNGGCVAFGPRDGFLYVGLGDGGSRNDPGNRAQNLDEPLGKMLRLEVDRDGFPGDPNRNYAIPPDNPFAAGPQGTRPEIWAYGLRNPWRYSFDRRTGDLYIGDVGQDRIEEIDFQPAASKGGENYGWRLREGTRVTGLGPNSGETLVDPIHEYSHQDGLAVVGGYVYRGARIPALQGTYFFADHIGSVWSLRFDGTAKSEFVSRTDELAPPTGSLSPIASFGEDAAGELYIVSLGGDVFRITAQP